MKKKLIIRNKTDYGEREFRKVWDDGNREADGTNHPNVGEAGAATMKYKEGNLLERWGRGERKDKCSSNPSSRASKYSSKLNPLWKSPVQVNKNNWWVFFLGIFC